MTNSQNNHKTELEVLIDIEKKLAEIDNDLKDIRDILNVDRNNLWKVLLMTIAGAFALIGIKLVIP